jgi:Ca2+-binding EF-hand superfamily protein
MNAKGTVKKENTETEFGNINFKNPLEGGGNFDNEDFDRPASSTSPARAKSISPMPLKKKRRYMHEHDQMLRSQGGADIDADKVETDLFDLFTAGLTRMAAGWDPVADLFQQLDDDGSGELEMPEVKLAMRGKLSNKEVKQAFLEMDEDAGGTIDMEEFREWWEKCVIAPTGHFHDRLGQMSRKDTKQQMRKCFDEPELSNGDRSPFVLQGQQYLVPLSLDDFWESVQGHLQIEINSADRAQLVAALVAVSSHPTCTVPSQPGPPSVEQRRSWRSHCPNASTHF